MNFPLIHLGPVPLGSGYVTSEGYRKAWVGRDHPMADSGGRCYEHRLVVAREIGRYLEKGEVVHHIDGNRLNNDPANLELLPSLSAHRALHTHLVTDAELRELILICGYRYRQLGARGIKSTHRINRVFKQLRSEGYDLTKRNAPDAHLAASTSGASTEGE